MREKEDGQEEYFRDRQLAPVLGWGEDQWKMYDAFIMNIQLSIT